jgi:RNA polymerase nonessential primary-like sigma factor
MKDRDIIRRAKAADAYRDTKGRLPDPKDMSRRQRNQLSALIRIENEARTILLKKHAGMICQIAKRWKRRRRSADMDDLIQAGRMGLLHALPKFMERRGFEFLTYATYWINNFVEMHCLNDFLIHVPVYVWEEKEQCKYWADAQRAGQISGLPRPQRHNSDYELQPAAKEPDRPNFDEDDLADLQAAVEELNGSNAGEVIRARFFEGATLEEVGERIGMTKERVRQVQRNAIDQLRFLIEHCRSQRAQREQAARLVNCH